MAKLTTLARLGVPASWAMERRMGGRKVRRAGLLNVHFPPITVALMVRFPP
jgi:hypothetical protein